MSKDSRGVPATPAYLGLRWVPHLPGHLAGAGKLVPGSSERTDSVPPSGRLRHLAQGPAGGKTALRLRPHVTPTHATDAATNVRGHGSTLSIAGTLPIAGLGQPLWRPSCLQRHPQTQDVNASTKDTPEGPASLMPQPLGDNFAPGTYM